MEEYDVFDSMSDELSYQRVSEDVHKKIKNKWNKLKKILDNTKVPEDVEKEIKDFNDLMDYFFE